MQEREIDNRRRGQWQLLLLMLIPILVVLLATFVFYTRIGMPEGTRNRGELIVPPLQINDLPMKNMEGQLVPLEMQKDIWTFVVMFPAQCDEFCRQQVWETRQTRVALGKYQNNIRRAWVIRGAQPDAATSQWLRDEHPDMQLRLAETSSWEDWVGQSPKMRDSVNAARFYLVDPRGFVMMYYLPEDTYKEVITDMKFLLKGVE